jgi:hypothetical protein
MMARSRSSFDDLDAAISKATALSNAAPKKSEPQVCVERIDPASPFAGVTLVSFDGGRGGAPADAPEKTQASEPTRTTSRVPLSPLEGEEAAVSERQRPPKLPDLSKVVNPSERCELIVDWIAEATGGTGVFLADGAGLPLAGAIGEAEARLACTGLVASSVQSLASAIPGNTSALFELHIGEGPFFQLIGFETGSAMYVVGLTRGTPLSPRQAHAIRLACRHALVPPGESLAGG